MDTHAIVCEILDRLQRKERMTQDLLDRIPPDTRIALPLTIIGPVGHGIEACQGTLLIETGAVTFHELGEWPN